MLSPSRRSTILLALGTAAAAAPTSAQLSVNNSGNPTGTGIASFTENVDFGDVDLDGDWDAVFADGGDQGNDQNRIWINRGGLQAGPLGAFLDQTSTRFPVLLDDSRDIEFADIDNDGDLDIYSSNTAQLSNQGNHWWINGGGLQGATLGFYTDETTQRWVGLGQAGSSIAPGLVSGGTFIDWSCDCDFGDLDNDGDLDLAHSTYGGAFGGNVPTRIFLNNGAGVFTEFNPTGVQLTGNNINNGTQALWAEGVHQSNTTNNTGAQSDVANSALDIDLGDIDGDFDLDLLHGSRIGAPRMFTNRLEENGGTLARFRDVTTAVFPASYWSSDDNYEQEMGDMDGDGDLEVYGLNWNGFNDRTFRNNGAGVYTILQSSLPSSGADDNEGDFIDYDNDGDMDLFVANFGGQDKLYNNNGTGTLTLAQQTGVTAGNARSLDADAADLDGDGDYDLIVAEDGGAANTTLLNGTGIADTRAPYLPALQVLANGPAAGGFHVVRTAVYDNAPYYLPWYNPTRLEVTVDGIQLPPIVMASSAGQIFRGTLARTLVGAIGYRARSEDEYGNVGLSVLRNFTQTGGPVGTQYGTATPGNLGTVTHRALSLALAGSPLYLAGENLTPGALSFFVLGLGAQTPPLDLSNGLLLNVALPLLLIEPVVVDANGDAVWRIDLPAQAAGLTLRTQVVALDGAGAADFASSRGLALAVP